MNKVLLTIGALLIVLGLVRPNISNFVPNTPQNNTIVVISPPSNSELKQACEKVIEVFKVNDSSRSQDAQRLSSLYMDLSILIELDGEDTVIKTTDELRQANSITGLMLRMNIKDKYPKLADAANSVIVAGIGDDIVPLDASLRAKAVETFRGLAWACNEGSK